MYKQEKTDALVQARVMSTTLATVARFFATRGQMLPSRSFLVRLVLEDFEGILIKGGHTERVASITDARAILTKLGLGELNPSGRGGRNYMEELQREVYDFEGWDASELESKRTKADVTAELERITSDPVQMEQVFSDVRSYNERTERQQKRSQAEHDALGDVGSVEVVEE